jgi:hypothetical protein
MYRVLPLHAPAAHQPSTGQHDTNTEANACFTSDDCLLQVNHNSKANLAQKAYCTPACQGSGTLPPLSLLRSSTAHAHLMLSPSTRTRTNRKAVCPAHPLHTQREHHKQQQQQQQQHHLQPALSAPCSSKTWVPSLINSANPKQLQNSLKM